VLPTSDRFAVSSAAQRLVVAATGWEIFRQNPVVGVGWQRSASPRVIGSPAVTEALRREFPYVNPFFFPDVNPTTVHNAYVQILAELGIAGLALLGVLALAVRRDFKRILSRMQGVPGRDLASLLAFWLVVVLVWWNDNPICGGQTETYVVALSLGLLASLAGTVPRDRAD
jgi:O-antigen ligase